MAGRTEVHDALLLRAVDYRDADRIVTLLTRDSGKRSAVARGARRSRKRFGGGLEPCCVVRVELGPSRGELWTLSRAAPLRVFPALVADLRKIALAGACLGFVREVTVVGEPVPALFDAIVRLFERLSEGPASGALLVAFEAHALGALGHAPLLDRCGRCGRAPAPGQAALFDPAEGAIRCRRCGGGPLKLSAGARAALLDALGPAWAAPFALDAAGRVSDVTSPDPRLAVAEARVALDRFVKHHLGRSLVTDALWAQIEGAASHPVAHERP